jgi:hypothetical protein
MTTTRRGLRGGAHVDFYFQLKASLADLSEVL